MRLSKLTDEELMAEYQLGSEEAFSLLYARHAPKVFSFVKRRTLNQERAAELFQEVFVKMHKSKHLYNRTFPFLPWLFSVSHSVVVDGLRSDSKRKAESADPDVDRFVAEPIERHKALSLEPHLSKLADTQRAALQMRYIDEKTFEEIGAVLGTSPLNVRQIVSRGIKRLRELVLKGDGHGR